MKSAALQQPPCTRLPSERIEYGGVQRSCGVTCGDPAGSRTGSTARTTLVTVSEQDVRPSAMIIIGPVADLTPQSRR